MPPWPRKRVSQSDPIQFVGLDYLGPVYVKAHDDLNKIWICLFTCLSVRAIHLEWVMHGFNCSTIFELLTKIYFTKREIRFNNIR